jgi:hypothetical protein
MNADWIVPLLIFSVPIVAIAGGIVAGIVRSIGQQRMLEMAQRERIAAIERGIDPAKLPPMPQIVQEVSTLGFSPYEAAKRRAQGLTIGGLVTLFAGLGMIAFFSISRIEHDNKLWSMGLIPAFVGVALLISAWIVWPKNGDVPRHGGGAGPSA